LIALFALIALIALIASSWPAHQRALLRIPSGTGDHCDEQFVTGCPCANGTRLLAGPLVRMAHTLSS